MISGEDVESKSNSASTSFGRSVEDFSPLLCAVLCALPFERGFKDVELISCLLVPLVWGG